MSINYLKSVQTQLAYYKLVGEKTFTQLTAEQLNWKLNEESNSIVNIVQHLHGNMLSRWTDFLTTDGEKQWRNRDAEFEDKTLDNVTILEKWNAGWACLFAAINSLAENELENEIIIRNEKHTVIEAINRQLAHYPYHIGQIVYIGKMLVNKNWNTLSIAKGRSQEYNIEKFSNPNQ